MTDGLKDILSNLNNETSQDTLLKYLNGQLGEREMHEVEKALLEDEFEHDAVEGLQNIERAKLQLMVNALNSDLKKRITKKRQQRGKYLYQSYWWLYFTLLILLIIVVLIYLYLHHTMS